MGKGSGLMITELTQEQKEQVKAYYDKYYKIGSNCDPIDRGKATRTVKEIYRLHDYKEPKIIFTDSPLSANILINILSSTSLNDSLSNSLSDSLIDSLMASLIDSLNDSLMASLIDSLRASLNESLNSSLNNSLRDSLSTSLRYSLMTSLKYSLNTSLRYSLNDSLRVSLKSSLNELLNESLSDSLWDSLNELLNESLRVSLKSSLKSSLNSSLKSSLDMSLWHPLNSSLSDSLRDSLSTSLRYSLRELLIAKMKYNYTYFWGQLDCSWLCFYKYCEDVLGVEYRDEDKIKLNLMNDLLDVGYVYFYNGLVIVCDRFKSLKFDEEGRLHNEQGPAIEFKDGFKIYHWRGVRIPSEWIESNTLTAKEALSWENVEQRNAACQILGWGKILNELDATLLDKNDNPLYGELYEAELPEHGKQKFLKAKCGTGRDVVILADNRARTALEAGAMSYGLTVEEYSPEARS